MRNKRGAAPVIWLVGMGLITIITTNGFSQSASNGKLKSNGKKIWCKMQNKGAAYCDSNY